MSVIFYAKRQLITSMCLDLQLFFVRQQKTKDVDKELRKTLKIIIGSIYDNWVVAESMTEKVWQNINIYHNIYIVVSNTVGKSPVLEGDAGKIVNGNRAL